MNLLLDSNILIDALRRRNTALFDSLLEGSPSLSISTVSVGEIYAGIRPGEEDLTHALLAGFECHPVSAQIARRAGFLVNLWRRRGRTLTLDDMLIAATALEYDLLLVTDNRRDFPMPELRFYAPA